MLEDFFHSDDPSLSGMSQAFRELSRGTVRHGLDDRVLLEASFAPTEGRGRATMTLFYRLPSADGAIVDKVLGHLERRSSSSGYVRLGRGSEVSLRGKTRVRTSIVGQDGGESYLLTCVVLTLRTVSLDQWGRRGTRSSIDLARSAQHERA